MHISFLKKKNVIIASLMVLVLMVSYVNYTGFGEVTPTSENDNPLNAKLVNSLTEEEIMSGEQTVSAGFFLDYRIERDAKRSENIDTLKAITASSTSTEENISEANAVMIELVKLSEDEMRLENMIVSKGYDDCVVFLHDDYVNVLIKSDGISPSQAVQIQDIVSKQCNMPLSKIYIATTGDSGNQG